MRGEWDLGVTVWLGGHPPRKESPVNEIKLPLSLQRPMHPQLYHECSIGIDGTEKLTLNSNRLRLAVRGLGCAICWTISWVTTEKTLSFTRIKQRVSGKVKK